MPHRLPHGAYRRHEVKQRDVVNKEGGLQRGQAGGQRVEVIEAEQCPRVAAHGDCVAGDEITRDSVVIQVVSLYKGCQKSR